MERIKNKGQIEPFFPGILPSLIEVQKSIYSEKQMKEKMNRYLDLFNSRIIENEPWQRNDKKVFPQILILSEQRYALDDYPFRILQAQSFSQFLQTLKPKQPSLKWTVQNNSPTNLIRFRLHL